MKHPTNYAKFLISLEKTDYKEALKIVSEDPLLFSSLPKRRLRNLQDGLSSNHKQQLNLEETLKQGTPLAIYEWFSEHDPNFELGYVYGDSKEKIEILVDELKDNNWIKSLIIKKDNCWFEEHGGLRYNGAESGYYDHKERGFISRKNVIDKAKRKYQI